MATDEKHSILVCEYEAIDQIQQNKNYDDNIIENILRELGCGQFQIFNYILLSLLIFIADMNSMSYIFTAFNLDYRCIIPECENVTNTEYNTNWMQNAIPMENSAPAKCLRYGSNDEMINTTDEIDHINGNTDFCPRQLFNQSNVIRCDQFAYKTNKMSIVSEFNLTCEENEWKLMTVGSYNNLAKLLCYPLFGVISDRFGRKVVLFLGVGITSITGIIQSYSINYTMFVVFECLSAAATCAIFPTVNILAMEWSESKHRVIVNSIVNIACMSGSVATGVLALYIDDFRTLLWCIYIPTLVATTLVIFIPESLRWLLVQGKEKKMAQILATAERINKQRISDKTWNNLKQECEHFNLLSEEGKKPITEDIQINNNGDKNSLADFFTSKILVIRFMVCTFSIVAYSYILQGATIMSVKLDGDKYVNFIVMCISGLPGGILMLVFLKFCGRRTSIFIACLISSVSIVIGKYLLEDYLVFGMSFILIGKCFTDTSFLILFMYASEMWPTPLRQTIMSLCSTIGRLGLIIAPFAPLLANISKMLPFWSFGIVSFIAGVAVLILPETFDKNLPDTIEAAKNLGKS